MGAFLQMKIASKKIIITLQTTNSIDLIRLFYPSKLTALINTLLI